MPDKKTQGKERTRKRKQDGGKKVERKKADTKKAETKKAETKKAKGDDDRRGEKKTSVSGPRPFWSGTIAFGLVSLPVGLLPANRSKPVSLRMIDDSGTPLARRYFCEKEERALTHDQLVRGYEVEKNEFVVIEDRELDELAPEKSQEIDLKRFVALDEIDPMFFERAYFLTPEKGATKAYRLLASSMEDAGRAGIATFVMRGKEYLIAIVAEKGILRAETLRFHDELRTPEDVGLPDINDQKADRAQVRAFEKSIEALTQDQLDREALEDRHSQQILERVREKLKKGEDVIDAPQAPEDEAEQGGEVIDLMQVLKQSLARGHSPVTESPPRRKSKAKDSKEAAKKKPSARKPIRKPRPAARRQSASGSELAGASRADLYQRAQQLGIAGRSNMSKEQLIKAIGDVK